MNDLKVPITYTIWGTPYEAAEVQKLVNIFNRQQDRIQVKVMNIPHDAYIETLNSLIDTAQMPDCAIMSEEAVLQYAAKGYLADVSGMYAVNESKPLDSLAFRGPGGKIVAYSVANQILLLYYNKDMFDRAGIPYPPFSVDNAWTWDEFVAAAKKLTFDAAGKHPGDENFDRNNIVQYGAMVDNLTWQLEVWALSNGGGFYSPDGKQVIIDQDEAIEAIQKVAALHLEDNVAPLSFGLTDNGIQRSIIARNVAMATGGQWNIGTCLAAARNNNHLNYDVAVLPYMKKKVTINTGGPNVVFSQSRNQKEAIEFLKWYANEENNWFMVESGIWMPPLEKWYTDETFISAVMEYALKSARPASWYYVNNTVDFNNILGTVLQDVWTGTKTAGQAIAANIATLKRIHAGN